MVDAKRPKILIETALLGQGLQSLSNGELETAWQQYKLAEQRDLTFVWLQQGELCFGSLAEFLPCRQQQNMLRLDQRKLGRARAEKTSGFLTAAAVLSIAAANACSLVVTSGMGGVFQQCYSADLAAVCSNQAILLAAAPKDMLDYAATFAYYRQHQTAVWGWRQACCDGFVFQQTEVALDGVYGGESIPCLLGQGIKLLLNPIPCEQRLQNTAWLAEAVAAGQQAVQAGQDFHPAVNAYLNEISVGGNAELQQNALLANCQVALTLLAQK